MDDRDDRDDASTARASRCRRGRWAAAGTAVALGVVLAGGITLRHGVEGDGPTAAAALDVTRRVGIGQVAVSVPADWASNRASCNTPLEDTVYFPVPQDCSAPVRRPVSSAAVRSGGSDETGNFTEPLRPDGVVHGHEAVAGELTCDTRLGTPYCTQTFGIPTEDAFFTVSMAGDDARRRVAAVRDSLEVLPEAETTVPHVPGGSLPQTTKALDAAGLEAQVERVTCPPNAGCVPGVVDLSPSAGSVVPLGSTVTVTHLE